jgi:hypothetical protein
VARLRAADRASRHETVCCGCGGGDDGCIRPPPAFLAPAAAAERQGLTLVHFSAQLELCLTQEHTLHTLEHPLMTPYYGLHNPYVHLLSHTKR